MKAQRSTRLYTPVKAGKDGWTEWVKPVPKGYRIQCCDCGLVHEMEFKAFVETRRKGERFQLAELPLPIRAMFRAKRL